MMKPLGEDPQASCEKVLKKKIRSKHTDAKTAPTDLVLVCVLLWLWSRFLVFLIAPSHPRPGRLEKLA